MDTWYRKDLGNGVAASVPTQEIMNAFGELIFRRTAARTYSYDLALFSRYEADDNVALYFTPSAKDFALAFESSPCDKPVPGNGFALLVGDDRSWDIHFPGHRTGSRSPAEF